MNPSPHPVVRLTVLALLLGLSACAQFPLNRDKAATPEPLGEQVAADESESADVHGLAAWAAWIASANPERRSTELAKLRALDTPNAEQMARLGLLQTRPGHAGFAPQAGLQALNAALAASKGMPRHDIQTIAAATDATQAWLAYNERLRTRASAAEANARDLESKIRALTEIESGE